MLFTEVQPQDWAHAGKRYPAPIEAPTQRKFFIMVAYLAAASVIPFWPMAAPEEWQKPTRSIRNAASESWLERINPAGPKSCLIFLAYVLERLCSSHFRLDSADASPTIPVGIT